MTSHARDYKCDNETFFRPSDSHYERGHWPKCRERFISTAKDFEVSFSSVLKDAASHHKCIAIDEEILGGTPRIAGTRVPVYMVLDAIEYYGEMGIPFTQVAPTDCGLTLVFPEVG